MSNHSTGAEAPKREQWSGRLGFRLYRHGGDGGSSEPGAGAAGNRTHLRRCMDGGGPKGPGAEAWPPLDVSDGPAGKHHQKLI